MGRDDEIRYLKDKLDELQRDRTAIIDTQCDPATALDFHTYVKSVRRIDDAFERLATQLEQLTGVVQKKRL